MSSTTFQEMQQQFEAAITPNKGFKNEWELSGVKEFKMRDGVAWSGALVWRGLIAGTVECRGDGGCYYYEFTSRMTKDAFYDAVKRAYDGREMIDVEEDCFVNYLDLTNLK